MLTVALLLDWVMWLMSLIWLCCMHHSSHAMKDWWKLRTATVTMNCYQLHLSKKMFMTMEYFLLWICLQCCLWCTRLVWMRDCSLGWTILLQCILGMGTPREDWVSVTVSDQTIEYRVESLTCPSWYKCSRWSWRLQWWYANNYIWQCSSFPVLVHWYITCHQYWWYTMRIYSWLFCISALIGLHLLTWMYAIVDRNHAIQNKHLLQIAIKMWQKRWH